MRNADRANHLSETLHNHLPQALSLLTAAPSLTRRVGMPRLRLAFLFLKPQASGLRSFATLANVEL